jgi:hypothetical protein
MDGRVAGILVTRPLGFLQYLLISSLAGRHKQLQTFDCLFQKYGSDVAAAARRVRLAV